MPLPRSDSAPQDLPPNQVMPPLTADERAALKASIAVHGVLVPVELDENGVVIDGHTRVEVCGELGITDWPKIVRSGLSDVEKRQHARMINITRRHLTHEQVRQTIADQIRETPDWSHNRLAIALGADDKTVASTREGPRRVCVCVCRRQPDHRNLLSRRGAGSFN